MKTMKTPLSLVRQLSYLELLPFIVIINNWDDLLGKKWTLEEGQVDLYDARSRAW